MQIQHLHVKNLSSLQVRILQMLNHEPQDQRYIIKELFKPVTKTARNTVYRSLASLKQRGLIERKGKTVKLSGDGYLFGHGAPIVKGQYLDVIFKVNADDLKEISRAMKSYVIPFARFKIKDQELTISIGETLTNMKQESHQEFKPRTTIFSGQSLDVMFVGEIESIFKVFNREAMIYTKTDFPAYFVEKRPSYHLTVFVSPTVEHPDMNVNRDR